MNASPVVGSPNTGWRDNRRSVRVLCTVWLVSIPLLAIAAEAEIRQFDRRRSDGVISFNDVGGSGWWPVFSSIVSLAGIAAVMTATWRLARAHQLLGRPGTKWGPGWAVAGRVIPIAQNLIPVLQLNELWRGSDPAGHRHEAGWKTNRGFSLVPVALAVGVVAAVAQVATVIVVVGGAARVLMQPGAPTDALREARPWVLVGNGATLVVAVICSWMLVQIADRQQRLYEADPSAVVRAEAALRADSLGGPAPPGWYLDPAGRYPLRWWDGTVWTSSVSTGLDEAVDPLPAVPPDSWR